MNSEKINLNYLHALLGLLTPCLRPVLMDNAEQFSGGVGGEPKTCNGNEDVQ